MENKLLDYLQVNIYSVYTTDFVHSHKSRDLIAITFSKERAIKLIPRDLNLVRRINMILGLFLKPKGMMELLSIYLKWNQPINYYEKSKILQTERIYLL